MVKLILDLGEKIPVTGVVLFEISDIKDDREKFNRFVHDAIVNDINSKHASLTWVSYLVMFSPIANSEEIRCQLDIVTSGEAVAFGQSCGNSIKPLFIEALRRVSWFMGESFQNSAA